MKKILFLLAATIICCGNANAQFGKIGKLKDKAKEKVEKVVPGNASGNRTSQGSTGGAIQQVETLAEGAISSAVLAEHYNQVEQSLVRLEQAIADNDMYFLFEAPEGNEAKALINKSAEIKGFNANDPRYIELRDRYVADIKAYRTDLMNDKPTTKVKINDPNASKQDRLEALYTLLDYYEKKAAEAQYYREKEYYLSVAALCWKSIADAKLMQLNNAQLKEYGKRLNAMGRDLDYSNEANKAKSARLSSNQLLVADQVDMVGPLPQMWFQIVDYTDNDYSGDANVDSRLQRQTERPDVADSGSGSSASSGSGSSNDVTQSSNFFTIESDGSTRNKLSKWGKIDGNDIYVYSSKAAVIIPTTRFARGILEVKDLRSNLITNVLRPYGSSGWEVYDNNNTTKLGYVDGSGNVYKKGSFYCKMKPGTKPIWGAVVYLTKIFE